MRGDIESNTARRCNPSHEGQPTEGEAMRAMGQMGECNDAVSVARRVDGVVIGGLVGLTEEGAPLVDLSLIHI